MNRIMNMKSIFLIAVAAVLLVACGGKTESDPKSRESLKANIKQMEDSIAKIVRDPQQAAKMPTLTSIELINRLTAYYHAFPKDEYAADCLFKVHMKYGELNAHEKAIAYGDTLLKAFPKYKNRDFLLESLASTCDVLLDPRDTSKVRQYYTLLLKEPKVPAQKKAEVKARLRHLDMDFYEYINFQSQPTAKRK